MDEKRKAGARLAEFFLTNPLGEEVLEGTTGGLLYGASQLGSDQTLAQTGLETALAIAGGIGLGAAGRRIGARLGQKFHKDPLANQDSMVAMMGRTMGSETTAEGLKQQGRQMRQIVEQGLLNESATSMLREALENPSAFKTKYNLDPREFEEKLGVVMNARGAAAMLKQYSELSPEGRAALLAQLEPVLKRYGDIENAVANRAVSNMDSGIESLADLFRKEGAKEGVSPDARNALGGVADYFDGMRGVAEPVKGEQVGRAVGRFIGDEVGILGGAALGSVLAQQLGMESPKDRKIRELEAQLSGRG